MEFIDHPKNSESRDRILVWMCMHTGIISIPWYVATGMVVLIGFSTYRCMLRVVIFALHFSPVDWFVAVLWRWSKENIPWANTSKLKHQCMQTSFETISIVNLIAYWCYRNGLWMERGHSLTLAIGREAILKASWLKLWKSAGLITGDTELPSSR